MSKIVVLTTERVVVPVVTRDPVVTETIKRVAANDTVKELVQPDCVPCPTVVTNEVRYKTEVTIPGMQGPIGPPGPEGPPGPAGGETFIFEAPSAIFEWHIVHNLGRFPSVTVVDSAGSEIEGGVTYIDENTVDIDFTYAQAGTAYLN